MMNPTTPRVGRPTSIWRLGEIRWLFAARVLSVAGDWLFQIALIWLVLVVTNSTVALSVVAVAQIIPLLAVSVLASGRLSSGINPRRLAVVDLLQAGAAMVYPVLYWLHQLNLFWFVVNSVIIAILDSVSDPGLQAIVPQLVDREKIPSVHSLLDSTRRVGRIIGPGISSVILLFLPLVGLFVVDAGSFVVSAACLAVITRLLARKSLADDSTGEPVGAKSAGGKPKEKVSWRVTLDYLRANTMIFWLFGVRNTQNMIWVVYLIGVPVLVRRDYHAGPATWGVLIVVYAAGQLLGNFLTTKFKGYRTVVWSVTIGWLVAGLGFVGLGAINQPVLGAVFLVISGAGSASGNVASDSYVGVAVPVGLQPAAFSWQFTGNQITQLVGTSIFGVVLESAAPTTVFVVSGALIVIVSTVGVVAKSALGIEQATI